jgi:predicted  nucleic acid-binding Zn-ribbon protein
MSDQAQTPNPQTLDEATRQIQALRREVENLKAEMKPIDDLRSALYLFIEEEVTEAIDDRIENFAHYIRSEALITD